MLEHYQFTGLVPQTIYISTYEDIYLYCSLYLDRLIIPSALLVIPLPSITAQMNCHALHFIATVSNYEWKQSMHDARPYAGTYVSKEQLWPNLAKELLQGMAGLFHFSPWVAFAMLTLIHGKLQGQ